MFRMAHGLVHSYFHVQGFIVHTKAVLQLHTYDVIDDTLHQSVYTGLKS